MKREDVQAKAMDLIYQPRQGTEHDEKLQIENYLSQFEGNISMVARKMQISRNTLYKRIRKYNIQYKRR